MCEACTKLLNRRALLRGAIIAGSAAATTPLWFSDGVLAAQQPRERAAIGHNSPTAGHMSFNTAGASAARALAKSSSATAAGLVGTRIIPADNPNALAPPPIVSRKQWGADESIRVDNRTYAPVRKLIVHHTASANKPSNPVEVVRFVERYNASSRGFSDTGYNYLIDHKGVIYEGRAARTYGPKEAITSEDSRGWGVVGAHAKGNNAGSCGICLIGDFDLVSPTDAAMSSLVAMLAWKASLHRIDATASETYIDIYGNRRVFPNIAGHRQVGQTACPGSRLFKLLPSVRNEVVRRAGHWGPLVVDIPGVIRSEVGALRSPDTSGSGSDSGTGVTSIVDPGTGVKLTGYRVLSQAGTVYTAGKARPHGSPSGTAAKTAVAIANSTTGDGYWVLGQDGKVYPYGVAGFGDAVGKGVATDLTVTTSGSGYWILMANGDVYPFGDAGRASSPAKAGIAGAARKMAARPQGDGYWIVMADNSVRAFGAAPKLGAPTGAGNLVDIWPTPSGKGYWVLTATGTVAPFGDAVDRGDLKRSKFKWAKPVAHLVGTPSGNGYIIANTEGAIRAFGDAPQFASFGSSGMKCVGVAPAFG